MGIILGIDYGSKRIGTALADTDAGMAFPYRTFDTTHDIVDVLERVCTQEQVTLLLMGESQNYAMQDNPVMKDARTIADELSLRTGIPLVFEPEFLTSHQAKNTHELLGGSTHKEDGALDASAAAVIVQAYLDTLKNSAEQNSSNAAGEKTD